MNFNNSGTVSRCNLPYNTSNQVKHIVLVSLTCDAPLMGQPPVHCLCFQSQEGVSNGSSSSRGIPHIKLLPRLLMSEATFAPSWVLSATLFLFQCKNATKFRRSHWSVPVFNSSSIRRHPFDLIFFFGFVRPDVVANGRKPDGLRRRWLSIQSSAHRTFISFLACFHLLVCFGRWFKLVSMMCLVKCCSSSLPSSI